MNAVEALKQASEQAAGTDAYWNLRFRDALESLGYRLVPCYGVTILSEDSMVAPMPATSNKWMYEYPCLVVRI